HLALIIRVLCRKAENLIRPGGSELGVVIPERAALGCAAPRTGYHVPVDDETALTRPARARVRVDDRQTRKRSDGDRAAVRRRQSDVRDLQSVQVAGRTVVLGRRDGRPVDMMQV